MLDFNTEPYFNDFDEDNKFYSILFRPSVAVQARELNQFQTILQNQIKQHGNHIFKNGTVVIPGEFDIKPSIDYVKLTSIGNVPDVSTLIGLKIKSTTSGLEALVIHAISATETDPATLYVGYTNKATNNTTEIFANSETISSVDDLYTGIIAVAINAVGFGSLSTVKKGVYYVDGNFVLCEEQTTVLEKYGVTATKRIGFNVSELIVTSDDVGYESLLDNAQGSYNYAAPGAHRHFIDLILTNILITDTDTTFIELGRVVNGIIVRSKQNTDYSELEKTFARRTYDESGDYTVRPFRLDVREHRNNDRGTWLNSKAYEAGDIVVNASITYTAINNMIAGLSAPVHTSGIVNLWEQTTLPVYNRGVYSPDAVLPAVVGSSDKLAFGLEPGKAYVNGFEITTLSTKYVEVDKPRDLVFDTAFDNNSSVNTSIGSFVQVTEFHNLPPMTSGAIVSIYDSLVTTPGTPNGNVIGTCRVRGVQSESGTSSATYCKVFIYDVKLNVGKDFSRDVKSFYYASSSFTSNVTYDTYSSNVGTVTSGTNPTALVGNGTKWLTGTTTQTLRVGDWVYWGGLKARVSTIPSADNAVLITGITAAAITTGVNAVRIQTELQEPNNTSLVFDLPYYANQSIVDHIYYVTQSTNIVSAVSNTLNISVASGTLLPDASNYYVQDASGNSIGAANFTVVPSGGTAVLTFSSPPTTSYTVFATVYKTGVSARKTKTLTSGTSTFTLAQANTTTLLLGNPDCFKLVNIFMGSIDITDWYTFNDGQKDSYYDYGSITLKPSYPTPTAGITVNYQYFVHTSGDFCDLSSYINIDYSMVPSFNGMNLRDTIDFRPVINAFSLKMPKRGYNMSVDLTYYLARQDKISIDTAGNFFVIKGSSSLNPGEPLDSSTGMQLYSTTLAPYTFDTINDVIVSSFDNKRYTMKDIGTLEKRITNLEYYTALSLLEQETVSLSIPDASGMDRFKNGFIVDSFKGHNIGDSSSPDYMCTIDAENGELRPFITMDNVNLIVDTVNSNNYKLWGDLVTLPLAAEANVVLAQNTYASRTEFVNPFAVFTFIGNVKLNPSSDDWFEVYYKPDVITNREGNFNIMYRLAAAAGLLNTRWNAWQTQWTGASRFSTWRDGQWGGRRHWVNIYETEAHEVGQSRTGIRTSAVEKIDQQLVADKLLSVAVIPYIRSRYMLIQAKGLKPLATFNAFFDDIAIASYCTPATIFSYTPISGSFDSETNSGINASLDIQRRINGDTEVCLNIGDIVTGATSLSKAVVVGKEKNISNSGVVSYKMYVLNASGAFTAGETITGSISGAVGTYLAVTTKVVGDSLVTGVNGDLNLLFHIPNTDSIRFRTGTREFKLVDTATATGEYTSKGVSLYSASGTTQTREKNIVATRNVEFVDVQATPESRVITESSTRVIGGFWYDPLAQTFLVESTGGAFISKVDLFFASKDGNLPVTVELREVVNGYPGAIILPFSRVTIPAEAVNLSSTIVQTFDGVNYPKYDTATTVNFPSPVYVKDRTEYALVILSDSNQYKVWISQMGDKIPDSDNTISKQPYMGVLFKSQNASTWTANQDQDLKFTIWRANFDTTVSGDLVLTNDLLSKITLEADSVQTLAGSSTVRIWHRNHGFKTGDSVTLSNAVSTDTNITSVKLNSTYTISNPTLDSYTIVITGSGTNTASTSGFTGGTIMQATRYVKYETIQPNIRSLGFSDTSVDYTIVTTEASTGALNTEESCINADNNYYNTSKVVPSGSTGKLNVKVLMSTTNPALSPIIDTHGTSAITIGNKIDSPTETNTNVANIDNSVLFTSQPCTLTGSTLTANNSTYQDILKRVIVGTYIMFSGSATNTSSNNVKFLVTATDITTGSLTLSGTSFTTEATASLTVNYYNAFFDEITPIGSSTHSKYISKVVVLANQSSTIRIKYAVCAPTESDVLVYYKIGTNGTDLSTVNWTLFNPDSIMPKTAIGSDAFYDVDYTASDLSPFNIITVKLVMKSTNTSAVPRVKDLRIIACA